MSVSPREALPWQPLYPDDRADLRKRAKFSGIVLSRELYIGLKDGDKIALAIVLGDYKTVIRLVERIPSEDDLMNVQKNHRVTVEYLTCEDGSPALLKFTVDWSPAIECLSGTTPLSLADALDRASEDVFRTVQAVNLCTLWGDGDEALQIKITLVCRHLNLPPGVFRTALTRATGNRLAALDMAVRLSGERRSERPGESEQ